MRSRCTYRVQLRPGFGFADAAAIAGYLAELGVSHLYCSPYLQAVHGSTHGYDVVDPGALNEDLGGAPGHELLCDALHEAGLGQVIDVVPNHMARDGRQNRWWWDVLENGPASKFAPYFDVDWGSDRDTSRVLIAVLADRYGAVLEAAELSLDREGGSFVVRYQQTELPLCPESVAGLLARVATSIEEPKLGQLADAYGALPERAGDAVAANLRHEEKTRLAGELAALCDAEPRCARAIDELLVELAADPLGLDALLQAQHYRLAYWGVADEEVDYRRFLNIGELIGMRVEDAEVFDATHRVVVDLVRSGVADGVRVDHVDGLADPEGYLHRLRHAVGGASIVVEKVLSGDEQLRRSWPVQGTTGYDFLGLVNGLFVDPAGEAPLLECYEDFVADTRRYDEILRDAKRLVATGEFSAEVSRLEGLLSTLCDGEYRHRDRTHSELRAAIVELLCSFDVYRTYAHPNRPVDPDDARSIDAAVAAACDAGADPELTGFLAELLTQQHSGALPATFVSRFQQLCSAVEAKGEEDTALYRYLRLVSLNEVGSSPQAFGTSPAAFHAHCARIAADWPETMLTLETHDTKRSADVRARLNVLSEMPSALRGLLGELDAIAAPFRPALLDRDTEYLVAQSAVGAWPVDPDRLVAYLRKATKEAKVHTTWNEPNEAYDVAVESFVRTALDSAPYRDAVETFLASTRLVELGRVNSLAQTTLALTAPGVPDLFQGTELWHLAFVDPDNRGGVDFARRRALLASLAELPSVPLADDHDGIHKLWLVARILRHRREHPDLYATTEYTPLELDGDDGARFVAFRRDRLLVVVPRLTVGRSDAWTQLSVELPGGRWRDVLTGRTFAGSAKVGDLLDAFPGAVLAHDHAGEST